jgi:hypothetical protein
MDNMYDGANPEERWISVRGVSTYVLQIGEQIEDDRAIVIIPGS